MVRHWTSNSVIICSIRSIPTGGNFFFAVIKSFEYKIAISANFVQTVKNSNISHRISARYPWRTKHRLQYILDDYPFSSQTSVKYVSAYPLAYFIFPLFHERNSPTTCTFTHQGAFETVTIWMFIDSKLPYLSCVYPLANIKQTIGFSKVNKALLWNSTNFQDRRKCYAVLDNKFSFAISGLVQL